ncbi:hypothetical protein [Aliikangiella maris]|uniref:Uncharacterized protein n=2 Tax=Aliikangiella maris TaxID=3162458 RepID=A0ABV2BPL9_9GAMM
MIAFWGVSQTFYTDFYNAPIARYLWFPYWVVLECITIFSIYYAKPLTLYCARQFNLKANSPSRDELHQELIIAVLAFIALCSNIFQLASALSGYGFETAEIYTLINRLTLGMTVIALIIPGKKGLMSFKDLFSEKNADLASDRINSNQSVDRF